LTREIGGSPFNERGANHPADVDDTADVFEVEVVEDVLDVSSLLDLVDGVAVPHGCLKVSPVVPAHSGGGAVGAGAVEAAFTVLCGRVQRVHDDLEGRLGYPDPHPGAIVVIERIAAPVCGDRPCCSPLDRCAAFRRRSCCPAVLSTGGDLGLWLTLLRARWLKP